MNYNVRDYSNNSILISENISMKIAFDTQKNIFIYLN